MLDIKSVSKSYDGHQALTDVSFSVKEGSIYGLLGPNGAGKTSLIRIINQITRPDTGTISIGGEILEPSHIAQIGYLPEERGLYPKMKVQEQLLYFAQLKGMSKKQAKQELAFWIKKFEIQDWLNKKIEELSKGMAQKIQFISTVIHKPKLLIFDEPFTGFDPVNSKLIKEEILQLNQEGATIIFSTHRMDTVEELCSEISLINKSKLVLQGSLKDIKEKYKKNLLAIELKTNNKVEIDPTIGHIQKQEQHEDQLCLEIQVKNQNRAKLISNLMKTGELTSLKEIVPSLDEIFIEMVSH